jgi:alpha-mannosidase
MTLQDAGWKYGPILKDGSKAYQPTEYTTWRNYFENVAIKSTTITGNLHRKMYW